MQLFSSTLSQRQLARRCGSSTQLFGIHAAVLDNGVERGIRTLDFRTGSGFRFTVLVDRAFDIGNAEYRGAAIGWHSPSGFRHPGLHDASDERGLGWLRSFSGLMVTCGLDHILFMESDSGAHYLYGPRTTIDYTLHGRVSTIPGLLHGYGEQWDGDECTLWCEGTVMQAAVFGENLHLVRRIEAKVGESRLTIRDRVVNRGFCRTPHMLLYHINLGYPLLDEGSEYIAPILDTPWAAHADRLEQQQTGVQRQSGPQQGFLEQAFEHRLAADAHDRIPAGLVNRSFDGGRGLGFTIEVNRREFPCHFQWQNYLEGLYAMGIEPSTNHALGRKFAAERGELCWLEHGESSSYTTVMSVLENNEQIDNFAKRVRAICPAGREFPVPSGKWD